MKKGHTPGPWEAVTPNPPELWDTRIFAGTRYIGMIGNSDNHDGCDEANARLIAAAPDMLDCLHEIIDYRGGADSALNDEYVMDRVYAAIAKATGREV